jgi:tRNA A37 threonylcarbamoyltransferase TsaD
VLTTVTILAIESSCDDTSVAVLRDGCILSNLIANQDVHMTYGGVVPELASRAHQANIVPVTDLALRNAGITPGEIDAVAFTRGPGLLGSLLYTFAKDLIRAWYSLIGVITLCSCACLLYTWEKDPITKFHLSCFYVCCIGCHARIIVMKTILNGGNW